MFKATYENEITIEEDLSQNQKIWDNIPNGLVSLESHGIRLTGYEKYFYSKEAVYQIYGDEAQSKLVAVLIGGINGTSMCLVRIPLISGETEITNVDIREYLISPNAVKDGVIKRN